MSDKTGNESNDRIRDARMLLKYVEGVAKLLSPTPGWLNKEVWLEIKNVIL